MKKQIKKVEQIKPAPKTEKKLGKIKFVSFGHGGYQGCMLGLNLQFEGDGYGCGSFVNGGWHIKRSDGAQWTEADRSKQQAEMCAKIIELLKEAKVDDVSKLKNIPVELEFEGMSLKSWRILKEVL